MFEAWRKQNMPFCNHSPPYSKETIEWTWGEQNKSEFVELLNDDRDVTFHKRHSGGTAVVRGTEPMFEGQHFWEIQMISPVYGTDIMVGIGTHEADMTQVPNAFISRLGIDNQTWGFSYTGSFHHNGEFKIISTAFDQGSIIGMHLDLWNGTLSFYKNKRHLGIASKGLKGKTLYAMASSTAACSGMRILKSCSFPSSLQFLCCAKLRDLIPDEKGVLDELPIPPGLKLFLRNNLDWLLTPRLNEEHPCKDAHIKLNRSSVFDSCVHDLESTSSADSETNSTRPALNYVVVGQPNVVLQNFNRFQRRNAEHSVSGNSSGNVAMDYVGQPNVVLQNFNRFQRRNAEHGVSGNSSGNVAMDYVEVENIFTEEIDSDDSINESEPKRLKYSYNYYVGLSDPDSDVEL